MRPVLSLGIVFAAVAAAVPAQLNRGYLENKEFGFKVHVPNGWTEVPLKAGELYIVGKFMSDKEYVTSGRTSSISVRPSMTVVVFDESKKRYSGNYRDYLKNTYAGYYFAEEKSGEVAGVPTQQYVINFNNDEHYKTRLFSWVYQAEGCEVAVVLVGIEDRMDQLMPLFQHTLNSFRLIDREKGNPDEASADKPSLTSELWTHHRETWLDTPIGDRIEQRKKIEANRFEDLRARTPDSWTIEDSEHFVLVYSCDQRFAHRVGKAADALYEWCEDRFGKLSPDYVRRGVVRICKDPQEFSAYQYSASTTSLFESLEDREAVTFRDDYNGTSGRVGGTMYRDIMLSYLRDKDPYASANMPLAIGAGLLVYVSNALQKGSRLEFEPPTWQMNMLREAGREGRIYSLRQLLTMKSEDLVKLADEDRSVGVQLGQVIAFLEGPGRRNRLTKNYLTRCAQAAIDVGEKYAEERERVFSSAGTEKAKTEQEEEELRDLRKAERDAFRSRVQAELVSRTCDFSDREWDALERAYQKFMDV